MRHSPKSGQIRRGISPWMASHRDALPRAPGPPYSLPGPWRSELLPPAARSLAHLPPPLPAPPPPPSWALTSQAGRLVRVCVCMEPGDTDGLSYLFTSKVHSGMGTIKWVCATQSQTARVGSNDPPEGMGASSAPIPWTRVAALH